MAQLSRENSGLRCALFLSHSKLRAEAAGQLPDLCGGSGGSVTHPEFQGTL